MYNNYKAFYNSYSPYTFNSYYNPYGVSACSVTVTSSPGPLPGQSSRSSSNFDLPKGKYKISLQSGISFNVDKDNSWDLDQKIWDGARNGVTISSEGYEDLYISGVKGASSSFVICFEKIGNL